MPSKWKKFFKEPFYSLANLENCFFPCETFMISGIFWLSVMAVFLLLLLASIYKEKLNFVNSSQWFQWEFELNILSRGSPGPGPSSPLPAVPQNPHPRASAAPRASGPGASLCHHASSFTLFFPKPLLSLLLFLWFLFTFVFFLSILPLYFLLLEKNGNQNKPPPFPVVTARLQEGCCVGPRPSLQPQSGGLRSWVGGLGLHQDQAPCLAPALPTSLVPMWIWDADSVDVLLPGTLQLPPDQGVPTSHPSTHPRFLPLFHARSTWHLACRWAALRSLSL